MNVYRVYCNGYNHTSTSRESVQSFIDGLRYNCAGETVTIHAGKRHGDVDVFPSNHPVRREVLSA